MLTRARKHITLFIKAKEIYIARINSNFDNPETTPKTYCSVINRFLNNKGTPIVPITLVNGKLISSFLRKAKLFNHQFVSQ